MAGCESKGSKFPNNIREIELRKAKIAVRKIAEAIGELADWEWEEEIEGPETGKSFYRVFLKPKTECWFSYICWESKPTEIRKYVEMGTSPLFPGYHWTAFDYPERVKRRLKEAWEIERKWMKKANEKFNIELKDMGPEFSAYYVTFEIDRIDPEEVRKYFMAMKWAYEMAKKELEEKGIVITDKILDLELKLEDDLEVTEEDIKAALGEV